jgi:Protein of unknown function (DUF4435)
MAIPQYTQQEYLGYIRMSKNKHLLVEGVTDKQVFLVLFDEWKEKNDINVVKLEIDTAENLSFSRVPRNCDRVKKICQSIETEPYNQKLVGFIDREFNEFEYVSDFQDKLNGHKVEGRLVWSRGHSIENYFFEYSILRESFRNLVVIDCFSEALELFSHVLESILKIACAVSLASERIGKLKRIRPTISRQFFQIINNEIVMKLEDFKQNLIDKYNFTLEDAENFCTEYTDFNTRVISFEDIQVIRWLCDGHTGMNLIRTGYDLCIDQVDATEKEVDTYPRTKEIIQINNFANSWVRKALDGQCAYPQEVFQLFGIDT